MQSEDEASHVLDTSYQHGSSFSQEEWSDGDDASVGNVSVEVRRLPMGENESGQKGETSPSESFDDDDDYFGFDEDGDSLAAKLSAKMAQTEADAGHSSDADSWDAEPDADKSFEMPSGLSHSGQMGSGMMTLIRSSQVKVDFTDQESSFAEEDDDFEFDASEDDDNVFQKMSSRMSRFTTSAPLEEPAVDDFDDVEEADEDTSKDKPSFLHSTLSSLSLRSKGHNHTCSHAASFPPPLKCSAKLIDGLPSINALLLNRYIGKLNSFYILFNSFFLLSSSS